MSHLPNAIAGQVQYATPASLDTVTITPGLPDVTVVINPASTIAALTVTLPSTLMIPSQRVTLACSQIVTALTMNGGTIVGALASLAVGGFGTWVWSANSSQWFRAG